MKTDQQPNLEPVFPQNLRVAISKLKNRLQRQYEQAYPGLRDLIRIVLDEEEAKAWELSFPHLLLPDLVEAHVTQLGLQPVAANGHTTATPRFTGIESLPFVPALCG